MKMINKKRGFFFIVDAVLAVSVLVVGIVLISTSYVKSPQQDQVALLSDDLINFLSSKKIKDLNNPYAGIGGELWNDGNITNGDNTLLQQIGEFYSTSQLNLSEKFIQNVSVGVIPTQFRYEVWMNSFILYPKTPSSEHMASRDNTKLLLTSKKITFGIKDRSTDDIWGPYKAEVFIWLN